MHPVLFFIRRNVYRLSLTLGIFAFIEVFMHSTEGTKPNYMFPWGHYVETLSGLGVLFLAVAYFTRIGPYCPQRTAPAVTAVPPESLGQISSRT